MFKSWKWFGVGILAVAISAVAAEQILYQTSGLSKFILKTDKDNLRIVDRTIQDYHVLRGSGDQFDTIYLVDSQLNRRYSLDVDGVFGNLKWSVRTGDKLQYPLWNKAEVATLIDVDENYNLVVTGLEQCCGAMTGYRIYDVTNGNLILSFNSFSQNPVVTHPFVVEVPNSALAPRFLGVVSADSTRDQDFQTATEGMVQTVLVKFGSKTQFYQRLQIDMKVADGFAPSVMSVILEKNPAIPDSDKIEIIDDVATLWNVDGSTDPKVIQGVQLKIVLNGGEDDKAVIIPVIQDRLSLEQATIPEGVNLRALPL
ncbi:MAG: hypothetical protein J7501_17895 [Bdellovibrio sp.]|nr:hypothetical protein [Bdellovibrio sp.]